MCIEWDFWSTVWVKITFWLKCSVVLNFKKDFAGLLVSACTFSFLFFKIQHFSCYTELQSFPCSVFGGAGLVVGLVYEMWALLHVFIDGYLSIYLFIQWLSRNIGSYLQVVQKYIVWPSFSCWLRLENDITTPFLGFCSSADHNTCYSAHPL